MSFDVDNHYSWATHQPMIKAVMDLLKPDFVMELGSGYHSTLVFKDYWVKLLSIDDNKEWVDYLNITYNLDIVWHQTGIENANIKYTDLPKEDRDKLHSFYKGLLKELSHKKNLLFVDNFTSGRYPAIKELKDYFWAVIYHDCQPEGIEQFSYNLIDPKGFNRYYLKSEASWTCLMIHTQADPGLKKLKKAIQPWLIEFKMKYPELPYMILTKNY